MIRCWLKIFEGVENASYTHVTIVELKNGKINHNHDHFGQY